MLRSGQHYTPRKNSSAAAQNTGCTSATVSGLAAATAYSFTVTAYNSAGESAASGAVHATTASSGSGGGGGGQSRQLRGGAIRRPDQQPGTHAERGGPPGRPEGVHRRVRDRQWLHPHLGRHPSR